MKILKMALAAAFAVASASATASVVEKHPNSSASQVSTCYYQYSIITEDGTVYDVYECYPNGDGSY